MISEGDPTAQRAQECLEHERDARLVRLHPGEADSIDARFRADYTRLVRVVSTVVRDQRIAEDAVQEAFARAMLRWRRVSQLQDPSGWILRVALNRCRSAWRTETRRSRRFAQASRPEASELQGRDLDLWDAVGALPPGQRAVVALHYLADLPVATVAEQLGISPGTVKSQLSDARARLRRVLEERTDGRP